MTKPARSYRRRLRFEAVNPRLGDRLVDMGAGQGDALRDPVQVKPGVDCVGLEKGGFRNQQARKDSAGSIREDRLVAAAVDATRVRALGTVATCSEPAWLQAAGFPFFDLCRVAVIARVSEVIENAQRPGTVDSGAGGAIM